jgi:hypothetical protein
MKTLNWKILTFALLALVGGAAHSRAQTTYTLFAFTNLAGKPAVSVTWTAWGAQRDSF